MLWPMAHEFRHLFTPLRVGGLTLKNRIFSTGHAEAMAEDGKPGPRLRAYHEAKARGGCGPHDHRRLDERPSLLAGQRLEHDRQPRRLDHPGLPEIADAVHRHDCRVMSQLTHMGRRSQSDVESWHVLLAPSQIPEKVHREVPHEMEPEQIADAGARVRRRGAALPRGRARRGRSSRSPTTIWWTSSGRRSSTGGRTSTGAASRTGCASASRCCAEIRRQVGRDWVVGARISGDEMTAGASPPADMAEIARRLAASGLVDFLSIIGGARAHAAAAGPRRAEHGLAARRLRPARRRHQGGRARDADLPRRPHRRSRSRRPDPGRRARRPGRDDPRADRRSRSAAQGPRGAARRHPPVRRGQRGVHRPDLPGQAGHLRPEPRRRPRDGARRAGSRGVAPSASSWWARGLAGLEAARVAALRGHRVVLFEREAEVGGQVLLAARAPARAEYAGILRFLARQVEQARVDCRLRVEASGGHGAGRVTRRRDHRHRLVSLRARPARARRQARRDRPRRAPRSRRGRASGSSSWTTCTPSRGCPPPSICSSAGVASR